MRVRWRGTWLACCVCGLSFALCAAAAADAALFTVSVHGRDSVTWSVGQAGQCGRSGSGQQTVEFSAAHPVTVQIARVPLRGGQRLVFGHGRGGVRIAVRGTVSRTDNTTGSFTYRQHCAPIPAKDCATKALSRFEPSLQSDGHAGFTLVGSYWPPGQTPFHNCIGLATPVSLVGTARAYTGWEFGEGLPVRDHGTVATLPVLPQALDVGGTSRFTAHKLIRLHPAGLPGFMISDDGGSEAAGVQPGSPEARQSDNTLGGDRSIADTVSFEVALKRLR